MRPTKAVVPVGSRLSETRPIASLRWAQLSQRGIRFRQPRQIGSVEQRAIERRSDQLAATVLTRASPACDTKTDGDALKPMAGMQESARQFKRRVQSRRQRAASVISRLYLRLHEYADERLSCGQKLAVLNASNGQKHGRGGRIRTLGPRFWRPML